jgi:electron transfer flavoprotein beta subunit
VCIKQVPSASQVNIDEETGVLLRESAGAKLNPYDLFALEAAFRLRERHGGEVTTISMGPPQTKTAIREAFYMGADRGFLLSDIKFAGADVLATAYTISQGIRLLGDFDLIICGKQTTDGDTAQVGPAIAEYLGIPHVAWVEDMEVNGVDKECGEAGGVTVRQDLPDACETVFMRFPCLVTVERGALIPRLPSYKRMKAMRGREAEVLAFDSFPDRDESKYGLSGSPTKVVRMFPPQQMEMHEVWTGDGRVLANRMSDKLRQMKFL